ncbi:CaiB/BaiF CoA transferase family protein [Alicyclobacillus sp. ALC3]|uniref:CaiB/BaiF CoA transferase family protein n=1 Tax=Alicyclobacillus sp. ALC3 TaxID=2796143 RepID=UPI00237945A3|nr:CoA transferase [Alicyclobacillus sp. ALC3]WDL97676.1 CoA transferase [Alicyclobacillus sp. ALC3]
MSILSGIRVLDLTHYIAGPYCSQILADYGADVIKIERIEGEIGRTSAPLHDDISLYFVSENRNKRGLSLDMKTVKGREIFYRLVETADVVVTNYGSSVPQKLGFDYDTISAINPRISMVHITGFGATGPYKDYGAYDGVIQSMSGLAELSGHPDGPPTYVGFFVADHLAGLQGALGAMLALFHRERTGKGRFVDISMLDGLVSLLGFSVAEAQLDGVIKQRWGLSDRFQVSKAFPTQDGYVFLGAYLNAPDNKWAAFAELIGKSDWAQSHSQFYTEQGRRENREVLDSEISKWTLQHTKEQAFVLLQQSGIASSPVNNLGEVLSNPQIEHRGMVQTLLMHDGLAVAVPGTAIKIAGSNIKEPTLPPSLGEHSEEILADLGFSEMEIKDLEMNNIIRVEARSAPV